MKKLDNPRLGILALAALAVGFGGWNAFWKDGPPVEPAPMDLILEDEVMGEEIAWDLPAELNESVEFWIDFLKGRNYDKTRLWLERSGRYAPFIRQELRARGMPEDLIYFAMIESGFSNRAYSRAHAVGMWQFIRETGQRYGLEVSGYVDERRDPIRATDAALRYLTYMYDDFGSWYLAAAGYNSGENRIRRILRERMSDARGDEALYWSIREFLPRETRDYVPLMLAAAYIGKEPGKYGFHDLEYQEPLAFEQVDVPGGTRLELIASAAATDPEEVRELNAHLVRGMTPPGGSYQVRIPIGTRQAFEANFERVREEMKLATAEHVVGRGETLSHIASRYGVSVSAIQAENGSLNPRRIQVGQRIRVPAQGAATEANLASARPANGSGAPQWTEYRVRRGDTLWDIARKNNVSVRELQNWNGLGSARIRPGQTIKIRGA